MRLRQEAVAIFFKRPGYLFGLLRRLRALRVLRDFIVMYLALRRERAERRF